MRPPQPAGVAPGNTTPHGPDTESVPDALPAEVPDEATLRRVAGAVPDPELPVISLAELGVLREVTRGADGRHVDVTITPTYSGCPAVETMREEIARALRAAGAVHVRVHTTLTPPWSTDDITASGRRRLHEAGIAPPRPSAGAGPAGATGQGRGGPVPVELAIRCPQCGSPDTALLSRFSGTACRALRRCTACLEPFEHVKEV